MVGGAGERACPHACFVPRETEARRARELSRVPEGVSSRGGVKMWNRG